MTTETMQETSNQESEEPVKHSGFLDLPPELRNTVYRLILVEKDVIKADAVLSSKHIDRRSNVRQRYRINRSENTNPH